MPRRKKEPELTEEQKHEQARRAKIARMVELQNMPNKGRIIIDHPKFDRKSVRQLRVKNGYRADNTKQTMPSAGSRRQKRRAANWVAKQSRKRNRVG
jgi:hypothetical protein